MYAPVTNRVLIWPTAASAENIGKQYCPHQISGKLAPAIHFVKFLPPLPFSIEVTLKYWKPVVVAALKFKRKPNWKEFVKRK